MQRQLINTLVGTTLLLGSAMTLPAFAAGSVLNPAGTIVLAANTLTLGNTGTIDWIDNKLSTNNIVIGDHSFTIGSTVRVHTPQGITGKSALRRGVRVRYQRAGGSGVITDLWVLPAE